MKRNVGSTDKIIRVVLGIGIGYFAYSTAIESLLVQSALYGVSAVLLLTAFINFCPLYTIFSANTCELK